MSNVGLRGVGTQNVYGDSRNPNSSYNKIINNPPTGPTTSEWQI
jgi:hypothetical protein